MSYQSLVTEYRNIFAQITDSAFIQSMRTGELSDAVWCFYLYQDRLYLQVYAQTLTRLSAKMTNTDYALLLLDLARQAYQEDDCILAHFHQDVLACNYRQSPACFSYQNFLLAQATTAPVEVAIAAITPCFAVYRYVAEYLNLNHNKRLVDNTTLWLKLYLGEEFLHSVDQVCNMYQVLYLAADPQLQQQMRKSFDQACVLEWQFWDDSYQLKEMMTMKA